MVNNILMSLSILFVVLLAPHQRCYGFNNFARFRKLRAKQLLKTMYSDSISTDNFVTEEVASHQETVHAGSLNGLKEKDKIDRLPGQPDRVQISQYSGYVTVDPRKGKSLFYYFVESWNDASSKPLVLWFNAVEPCSGVGIGAFTEIGPFRVGSDSKTLHLNQYSWNREANILFLDLVIDAGFSYSHTSSDYKRTEDKTIMYDTYTFLFKWLERFPEYQNRDLYLVGESYIPIKLGQLILQKTKYSDHDAIKTNLKGIALGNVYTDFNSYDDGVIDYEWTHALISDEIYHGLKSHCNFSANVLSKKCIKYLDMEENVTAAINPFDIYAPLCNSTHGSDRYGYYGPCSVEYLSDYFRNPTVQIALHSNVNNTPHPWKICSTELKHWVHYPPTLLPIFTELIQEGIHVWLYSGDTDSIHNPITSTRYAIEKLGISVIVPWYPWYYNKEVGGYAVGYGNLTFVSVKGAGAFVPASKPAMALALFSSFLNGKLPPSK